MDKLQMIERIENGTEYRILQEQHLFMTRDIESDEVHVYGLFGEGVGAMYVGKGRFTMRRVEKTFNKKGRDMHALFDELDTWSHSAEPEESYFEVMLKMVTAGEYGLMG